MFGFDMEDIFNGYTKQDEFIARDSLIIDLLIEKGIVTKEEVKEKFDQIYDRVKETKRIREEEVKRKSEEAKKRLEELKKVEDSMNKDTNNLDFDKITNDLIGDVFSGRV